MSTPSCTLLIVFIFTLVEPQLKLVKSLHGSILQLERAKILIVACRQAVVLHSSDVDRERVDTQLTSLFVLQSRSLGNCDGAQLSKNNTGDATNNDVTNNVAVVNAILCTVADVRNQIHGIQHIHPAVAYILRIRWYMKWEK